MEEKEIKFRYVFEGFEKEIYYFDLNLEHIEKGEVENSLSCCYCTSHKCLAKLRYTGRKDKNDIEIYEGDIVTDHEYLLKGEVSWNYLNSGFFVRPLDMRPTSGIQTVDLDICKVIGNIYKNPKLIKRG